jgi:hypothetical protein
MNLRGYADLMSETPRPQPFVPDDFAVPAGLITADFRLEPLGPEHNLADFQAWTSSIGHIRATPGFSGRSWPTEMTADENRGDLERHALDFAQRTGFTYTVLDPADGQVIGCVYIYPSRHAPATADVQSWVTASRADLDIPLHGEVKQWLRTAWPFAAISYADR